MHPLDHVVYATTDLAATVERIAGQLGVRPIAGGQHVGRGTRNYLLSFGNGSYLEIIGPDPEQADPADARPFGIDELRDERVMTWAIRSTNIDASIAHAVEAGFDPGRAQAMQRATPEGDLLRWRLTSRVMGSDGGLVPFLLDWGDTPHPSSTVAPRATLVSIRAEHPEPESVTPILDALQCALTINHGPYPLLMVTIEGPKARLELQ